MRSWKKRLSTTVSLHDFKRLWTVYTLKKRNLSAFEAYVSYVAQKEPRFEKVPDLEKLRRYKEDLKKWGLTT